MSELHKVIAVETGSELEKLMTARAAKHLETRKDMDQFDLAPFFAILVTAGVTNKNLDAFDPWETYQARKSPIDKPVNFGHNQTVIRGHIIDCVAVGEDLQPLPDNLTQAEVPAKLHLVIAAVIYKVWEDPVVQAQVNEVLDKVAKGETFVSMEVLFRNFDFLLTSSTGQQKLLPKNEKTIGFIKHLRQYGGKGKVNNYTIARLLRQMTFSAVGIVDKPANPESIISASLNLFSSNAETNVYINLDKTNQEIIMSEKTDATVADNSVVPTEPSVENNPKYQMLHSEHTALKHAHDALQAEHSRLKTDHGHLHNRVEELNKKLDDVHKKTLAEEDEAKKKADSDDEAKASLASELETTKASLAALEAKNAELTTANDAMNATLEEFKKASRNSNRAEALMKIDSTYTKDTALQAVAKFADLSQEVFDNFMSMVKTYAERKPKEVTPSEVLDNARAEQEAQYGSVGSEINKAAADIANWLKDSNKRNRNNKVGDK